MLKWLKHKWLKFIAQRRLAREIDPMVFKAIAKEVKDLTRVVESCARERMSIDRIEQIRGEMEQLEQLTSKPEFKRLPPERRLKLKESLLQSKKQLMDSVNTASPPTNLLQ